MYDLNEAIDASRAAQGFPPTVEDPATIAKAAALTRDLIRDKQGGGDEQDR